MYFSRVIQFGAVIAFGIALFHPTGGVQIGGAQGVVFQSWLVLLLAPAVFLAATCLRRWTFRRQVARRRPRPQRPARPQLLDRQELQARLPHPPPED